MAALLASAPVTGLVMSMPSLPWPHAHSEARHSALSLFHPVITAAFPGHPQRLRRHGGAVALRDQRPQQAQLLALRGRLPAAEPAVERPDRELVLPRAFRGLARRGAGIGCRDSLRRKLLRGEPWSLSLPDPRPGAGAGRLAVVDVAQLLHPRQRRIALRRRKRLQRLAQLQLRPLPGGEQLQRLLQCIEWLHFPPRSDRIRSARSGSRRREAAPERRASPARR